MQIHLNADLKPYHTFGLAQQCQVLVEVTTVEQLIEVYSNPEWQELPKLMLGKGSNVLFTQFYAGVVIINHLAGIELSEDEHSIHMHVMGGEDWPTLVETTINHGWGGLENLALIPGCAGSAPIQNIGAYGVEFNDVCAYVDYLDLVTCKVERLTAEQCEFEYRDSVFKHRLYQTAVVVAVGLVLAKQWQPKLGYGPLQGLEKNCAPREVFELICQTRMTKLPDPQKVGNAGSFFKNPLISPEQYQQLLAKHPDLVAYPSDGQYKVAAGWLIDQCGLKGYRIGDAQVHPQQALVLTNLGNASVADVVALARYVVEQVKQHYQIALQHEVRFIGRDSETYLDQLGLKPSGEAAL